LQGFLVCSIHREKRLPEVFIAHEFRVPTRYLNANMASSDLTRAVAGLNVSNAQPPALPARPSNTVPPSVWQPGMPIAYGQPQGPPQTSQGNSGSSFQKTNGGTSLTFLERTRPLSAAVRSQFAIRSQHATGLWLSRE
jgi:hypothetical protein